MDTSFANPFCLDAITPDFLTEKRKHTDPIADNVIASMAKHNELNKLHELFLMLDLANGSEIRTKFTKETDGHIVSFLEATTKLPSWANPRLIGIAESVYATYSMEIVIILMLKALPLCYVGAKGAKGLYLTGKMSNTLGSTKIMDKRLKDTVNMLNSVFSKGGLTHSKKGISAIQKTRLIHSLNRHFLKNRHFSGEEWDSSCYGEPLNQEDMAGTLMSFSSVILAGLEQLNCGLKVIQREAYLHTWNITGYLLGIDTDLLPKSEVDGQELTYAILKHQAAPSFEGKALMNAWIEYINIFFPSKFFKSAPAFMISRFIEHESEKCQLNFSAILGLQINNARRHKFMLHFMATAIKFKHTFLPTEIIKIKNKTFNQTYLNG